MPAEHPVKRRRLIDGTKVLTKPFVSPLKVRRGDHDHPGPAQNAATVPTQPTTPADATPSTSANPATGSSGGLPSASSTTPRTNASSTRTPKISDPAELAAHKALSALEAQIRALRGEIDTLSQASKLASSDTDTNLEQLIQKWKLASQAAADELFTSAKERVDGMGGMAAWKSNEMKNVPWSSDMEESNNPDREVDSDGDPLPEEEQEFRRNARREARRKLEHAADLQRQQALDRQRTNDGDGDVSSPPCGF